MKKLLAISLFTLTLSFQSLVSGEFDTYTFLMKSIEDKKSSAEVKRIISEGADVNAIHSEYLRCAKPVLRYALDRGSDAESIEIINTLIKFGAKVNEVTYNRVSKKQFYGFMPLLTYAAIYSSAEIVQILINAGAKDTVLEGSDLIFKKTALQIAQELGRTDVVNVLKNLQ